MARKAAQKKEVNNDGKELFEALKLLEAEKGIPVDFMIDKIKKAIATACKNSYGNEDVVIDMDPESGKFDVFLRKEIVEEVENPNREIALEIVKQYDPRARLAALYATASIQNSLAVWQRRPQETSSVRASATASATR